MVGIKFMIVHITTMKTKPVGINKIMRNKKSTAFFMIFLFLLVIVMTAKLRICFDNTKEMTHIFLGKGRNYGKYLYFCKKFKH